MDYVERPVVRAIMSNLEPCSVLRTRRTIVQAFKRSSVHATLDGVVQSSNLPPSQT
jgi:hypothetical protein